MGIRPTNNLVSILTRLLLIVNENDNGAPKMLKISLVQKLISLENWTFLKYSQYGYSSSDFVITIVALNLFA